MAAHARMHSAPIYVSRQMTGNIIVSGWQHLAGASVTRLVTIRLDFCRLVG
jgi:hypothetical protein